MSADGEEQTRQIPFSHRVIKAVFLFVLDLVLLVVAVPRGHKITIRTVMLMFCRTVGYTATLSAQFALIQTLQVDRGIEQPTVLTRSVENILGLPENCQETRFKRQTSGWDKLVEELKEEEDENKMTLKDVRVTDLIMTDPDMEKIVEKPISNKNSSDPVNSKSGEFLDFEDDYNDTDATFLDFEDDFNNTGTPSVNFEEEEREEKIDALDGFNTLEKEVKIVGDGDKDLMEKRSQEAALKVDPQEEMVKILKDSPGNPPKKNLRSLNEGKHKKARKEGKKKRKVATKDSNPGLFNEIDLRALSLIWGTGVVVILIILVCSSIIAADVQDRRVDLAKQEIRMLKKQKEEFKEEREADTEMDQIVTEL